MNGQSLLSNIPTIASFLTLPATIVGAFTIYKGWLASASHRTHIVLTTTAIIVALASYTIDLYDRYETLTGIPKGIIQKYSASYPNWVIVELDGTKIAGLKDEYRVGLVTRFSLANIDRMTDDQIQHSSLFNIDNAPMAISFAMDKPVKGRIIPNGVNMIEIDLIAVPKASSIDKVNTLEDVATFGGKILATFGMGMPLDTHNATLPNQ